MRAFLAAIVLATGLVTGLISVGHASTSAYCEFTWGSLAKVNDDMSSSSQIVNLRSGRHGCFDRLVIDLDGKGAGWRVQYVDAVYADGSGHFVPLRGDAYLQLIVHAPGYNDSYIPTFTPAARSEVVDVSGYSTFRQVAYANSFEGQTNFGVGVRARLPFRVFYLDGPGNGSRIVLDVANRWR